MSRSKPSAFSVTGAAFRRLPFVIAAILVLSCAGTPDTAKREDVRAIDNVPFYPDESYRCGPASLAAVLNHLGLGVSPAEVSEEIFSEAAGGTLNLDLALYARRKGFKARQFRGSVDELKAAIDAGNPVIVMVDYGLWVYRQGHYMVVVGYGEDGIEANSGADRQKFIPFKNFIKPWERTGFWTLLITK